MKTLSIIFFLLFVTFCFACASKVVDDVGISAKVKGKLVADTETSAIKIGVDTVNGVVTLSGVVPAEREKIKAEQLARNTEGVKDVVNNITINPDSLSATNIKEKAKEAVEENLNDAVILNRLKAKLLIENITGVDVDVANGDVTLKGTVANTQQLSQAVDLARNTTGVKNVSNQLSVRAS